MHIIMYTNDINLCVFHIQQLINNVYEYRVLYVILFRVRFQ